MESPRQFGSYQVVSLLGRGGMGEVYRAHDSKLGRDVAIKTLPEDVKRDPTTLKRFEREARLLAALNHPNIAAIYGVDESPDQNFLVLELVEGETLAERLARSGALPITDALRIAAQVAEALEAAHAKGITHRDIKPANIKITPEGRVKVLDFGLAKALPRSESELALSQAATMTGGTEGVWMIGTPAYMSPEQARGHAVDARADIWAFGCLVYEILSGTRAFQGTTLPDVIAAVLEREPDWNALPRTTAERIREMLRRCLEKNPEQRLASIADARSTIELVLAGSRGISRRQWVALVGTSLTAAAGLPLALNLGGVRDRLVRALGRSGIDSIAVLPMANRSGDADQEYLADGITDALITDLSKLGTLRVISRTSTIQYKGVAKPLPEIARELHVAAIVEGSVQRAGDRVQIRVRLVPASSDSPIWAETYERHMDDLFAVQGDLAKAVVRQLAVAVNRDIDAKLTRTRTPNRATYEAYLRGMYALNKGTAEGDRQGLIYLQNAVDEDPADPLAYAGLAVGYGFLGHAAGNPREAFPRGRAAAERAIRLDDSLVEPHTALAEVKLYHDWDFPAARRSFEHALALNPNYAEALRQYSWYLTLFGTADQALEHMRAAQAVDPLDSLTTAWLGWMYWAYFGRTGDRRLLDEAMVQERKALELRKDSPNALFYLGSIQIDMGRPSEAIVTHQRAAAVGGARLKWVLARTYAQAGQPDVTRRMLAELGGAPTPSPYAFAVAEAYTEIGELEEALRWIDAAFEFRFSFMPWLGWYKSFAPLHSDARFRALVTRIGGPLGYR